MLQLIYASAATVEFSNEDLRQLLKIARQNNHSLDISGMLVFHEGSFLQILEGDDTSVLGLFDKIEQDERHDNVKMLLRSEIEKRSFGDWKMGFCNASGNSALPDQGFIDFFRSGDVFHESEADQAKQALMRFREGGWRQHVDT